MSIYAFVNSVGIGQLVGLIIGSLIFGALVGFLSAKFPRNNPQNYSFSQLFWTSFAVGAVAFFLICYYSFFNGGGAAGT